MNDNKILIFLGGLIVALVVVIGAIFLTGGDEGDESSDSTLAASTSVPATSTSTPGATEPAPAAVASLCVIGLAPGAMASVHTGPGDSFGLVAQLSHNATGVGATGGSAVDEEGDSWTEIVSEGGSAWVRSHFLTPGDCNPDVGAATYAVTDIVCGSSVNVRNGLGEDWDILGRFDPDAFDIAGTGVTALDAEGRTWVQIVFEGGNAWVAGWFVTPSAGPTITCGPGPMPWLLTANALGPINLGTQASSLGAVTGLTWVLSDANNDCTWHTWSDDIGVQAQSGTIVEIWAMSTGVAITPEGYQVGQSKAQALATFAGRTTVVPGPFAGEVIIVDATDWQQNFTYLMIENPFDTANVGTIRINDDGGYIEGGCS